MATLAPYTFFQEFDNNGNPLVGGKLYTYEAGTTTPKATFTDSTGSVANTNPVILNSSGRADVWLGDGGYKFVLTTSADVTIKTVDNVGGTSSTAFGADVQILTTNTTINNTYANAALVCTSPITLSLLASADAGDGFYISVRNASAGNVIIDPDTSELIDGASTLTIRSGFSALIINTGTAWRSLFSFPNNAIGSNDLNSTAISGLAPDTVASDDKFLFGDFSASDALKKGTISDIIALVPAQTILRNHIDGYQMSTAGSSTTMTIGAGQAANSTNAVYITLASSLNKTTSSWAVGTGNGGLDTGSIANNTWYHFYAIRRPDTGVVDVVFSTNATSPTLPTNYTQFRRIGSGLTNGSGQWVRFYQFQNRFIWDAAVLDITDGTTGTTAKTGTLASVPLGVTSIALVQALVAANGTYLHLSPLVVSDQAPATSSAPLAFLGTGASANTTGNGEVLVNTSQQFRYRTSANDTMRIATLGWIDFRGQE